MCTVLTSQVKWSLPVYVFGLKLSLARNSKYSLDCFDIAMESGLMEHASALPIFSGDVHFNFLQDVQDTYSSAFHGVVKRCLSVAINLISLVGRY